MPCEECRDLTTHAFRSADDLVHAVQTAAAETERGVLRHVQLKEYTLREREALESAAYAGEVPARIALAFACTVCGDQFMLEGDTATGAGGWSRNGEVPKPSGR